MRGRRIRIRKIVARASAFLILGAIVNVAVAWTLALLVNPFSLRTAPLPRMSLRPADGGPPLAMEEFSIGAKHWSSTRMLYWWDQTQDGYPLEKVVPSWWTAGRQHKFVERPDYMIAEARGWPMLSMWDHLEPEDRAGGLTRMVSRDGIQLPLDDWSDPAQSRDSTQSRALPLRIIWPGFLVNTLFYAATLWLLFAAPFALRRKRRRRRGLCPACAYPIGTSPVCTECGKPVRHRTESKL